MRSDALLKRRPRAQNAFKIKYSYHYNPEEYVTTVWYFIEEVLKMNAVPTP